MSPERLDGKDYSFPSDIWALGIIIYEMVTGKNPYPPMGADKAIILNELVRKEESPNLDHLPLSAELKDFIKCCLVKNPEGRANSMDLLNHQFILMYNRFAQDDDHITWLRQYNYEREQLAARNK